MTRVPSALSIIRIILIFSLLLPTSAVNCQVLSGKDFREESRWALYSNGQQIDGILMLDSSVLGVGSIVTIGNPAPNQTSYGSIIEGHFDVASFQGTSGAVLGLAGFRLTYLSSKLVGSELIIDQLNVRRDKKDGYPYVDAWAHINGISGWRGEVTIMNFVVALGKEEITHPSWMSSETALRKLRKAKEMHELGVYSQQSLDSLVQYIKPYLKE
jgi:hypothetical protein